MNEAAKKYILPYNFYLIVVGDRSAVEKKIMKYDSDEKITFLDHFAAPAAELKTVPAGVTLQTVVDNYLNALGGKDKISKITDATMKGKLSGQFGVLDVTSIYKTPYKKLETVFMSGSLVQKEVFDGTQGKSDGMQGPHPYDAEDLKDAKVDAAIVFEVELDKLGVQGTLLGIDLLDGKDAYKVQYIMPSGKKTYCWYSTKNNLLVKTSAIEKTEQGSMEVVNYTSDYREVNGVLFPFMVKTMFGDIYYDSIEVNTGVKDDVFSVK
ncbi:MAG: hypothetical protein LC101_12940 [Flavobacteriales bacterium]|nr:hypothetical protein [Flavobacteriales bacterium]